jgi:hypothetical protein
MNTVNDIINFKGSFEELLGGDDRSHAVAVNKLKEIATTATNEQLLDLTLKFDDHRCFLWLEDFCVERMGDSYYDFLDDNGL